MAALAMAAVAILLHTAATTTAALDTSQYSQNKVLDPSYTLSWQFDDADASIRFAVKAKTAGYVGLGFSEAGDMTGSDLMLGTVENGMALVVDAFAFNMSEPGVLPDIQQDIKTISGEEQADANGEVWTVLEFSRKLETGDCNDRPILKGINQVIWAIGATDLWQHHSVRGSTELSLMSSLGDDSSHASPSAAGCPASAQATLPVATKTQLQVPAISSPANMGASANTSTPVPQPPCTAPFGGANITFQHCQTLEGNYQLRWNEFSATTVTISFSHVHNGWIAFGISPTGEMIGSSVVAGFPTASISSYFLADKAVESVKPPGRFRVSAEQSEFVDGEMRILFNLELTPALMQNAMTIWAKGPHGAADGMNLAEHPAFDAFSGNVSFGAGKVVGPVVVGSKRGRSLRRSHGLLNAFAWGVLIPVGAILARYARVHEPTWFYAHVTVQSLGFLLGVGGFVSGMVLQHKSLMDHLVHFTIAVAILLLSVLQILGGVFRPDPDDEMSWEWMLFHRWSGRAVIVLSVVNIYMGLSILRPGINWVTAYSFVFILLVGTAVTLEIRKQWEDYIEPTKIKQLERTETSLRVHDSQAGDDEVHDARLVL